METGKSTQSLSALFYGSVAVPTEKKMDALAPLTAVYIQAVPAHPPTQQLFPRAQFPGPPPREPATLHLAVPPVYSKETLPFLTVHIAGGIQPLCQELGLPTSVPLTPVSPATRTKSAGKHVCPHCSRDCMKPSVLEKHLRCHTGERPYPCITCRVSFKTQSNLYKHKRTQAHARLSSESEHSTNSSVGSQDSAFGSSLCNSSLDSQVDEDSGSLEEEVAVFPPTKDAPRTDPEQPSTGDTMQGKITLSSTTQKTEPVQSPEVAKQEAKGNDYETKKQCVTQNRHLPLQRQEATLIFKEWEGTTSRGKPQSHASTDSGFSESADHNMDALPECITEHHEPSDGVQAAVAGLSQNRPDSREGISVREQRSLEEHISKLISENSVLVDDKQLETMRPRKVLSKQGSIDMPMPYTYKDSFHFDMRPAPIDRLHVNQTPVVQPPASVRTLQAPLIRSSSLPYSVTLLPPEQSSRSFSHPRDYVTTIRRGSSGPAHQTAFPSKSVDQQVPSHRLLVRQTAVDCNHATEGPFFTHSSTERLPVNSDLSCGVGGGGDTSGEPCDRKRPRKKAQKFTYNKWYTYKGGTFKKLYNTEKGGNGVTPNAKEQSLSKQEQPMVRSAKSLPECHGDGTTTAGSTTSRLTSCHPFCLPAYPAHAPGLELNTKSRRVHQACSSPRSPALSHVSSPTLHGTSNRSPGNHSSMDIIAGPAERLASKEKHSDSLSPPQRVHIPSDRKKQRTNPSGTEADHNTLNEPRSAVSDVFPTQNTNVCQVSLHFEQRIDPHRRGILPQCISASKVQTSVKPPASVSLLSSTKPSFLPKYQLKLPTATETKSTSSLHTLKMSKRNGDHGFTSISSSSSNQHCLTSYGNPPSSGNACTLEAHMFPGYPQSTEGSHSTQSVNQCESVVTVNHGGIPALAVSQRHCTTITTATATMRSHHKELCSPTVIQASTFKPVMVPNPEHQTRTVLHKQSIMTLSTGTQNCRSKFLSSSATTFTTFSPGHQLNTSRPHHFHTPPSLGQANVVSAGHTVPKLPVQMLPIQAGQVDPVQKVFHVQTADLQICLQIISDEQLALIEPRVKKQAVVAEKKLQTQALNSIVLEVGAGENVADQSTCDQREMDNMALPPSTYPRCITLTSEGQADVSHAQMSGNSEASWCLQPQIHPRSDSNHNTNADNRCCTSSAAQAEALPKAARHDARKAKGEPDHSVSPGLAAKNLHDVSLQFPGDILQEGSQHTPLRQRAITCSVEEVTAELNGQECSPAHLTQRGRAWAWTHAETSHVAPHPGDGASLFPDINIKICSASAEVNADPPVCSGGGCAAGGGDGVNLLDPGPGHSEAGLQPLRRFGAGRGLGVPLIHSSSSPHTAVWDSADTPSGLAGPQPSGPAHGGSPLGGGPASQKAPDGQGYRSSPWQPHVEEAEANSRADAGSAAGVPALPPLLHQDGLSGGPAARPSAETALPHPAPAGGEVNPARTTDRAPDSAPHQLPPSGETVNHDLQGPASDASGGLSPGAQRGCLTGTNPPAVPPLGRDPAAQQNAALRPTGDLPGFTWDAVSAVIRTALTHCSDTPVCCTPRSCPATQSASPAKPPPCYTLPGGGRGSGSDGSGSHGSGSDGIGSGGSGSHGSGSHGSGSHGSGSGGSSGIGSSCSGASCGGSGCTASVSDGGSGGVSMRAEEGEAVHVWKSWTCTELSGPAGDEGVVGCEDPLRGGGGGGGGGGGYPSNRHHHHRQEEEVMVVFSEAQLMEGSTTNSAWPLMPNCQGSQEESSSDDDDEGKLIIEL